MAEMTVGKVTDFQEGLVRVFEVEGVKIAVVKRGGEFHALDGICTHADYSFNYTRVRPGDVILCSSHMAVYDLHTGRIHNWPGLDDLRLFPVRVENDEVIVTNQPLPPTPEDA
jgi:biphenyl 2,3-dioxygenase ferredoxin subunit